MIFGLPDRVSVRQNLPKKDLYKLFQIPVKERDLFDDTVHKMTIIGQISPETVNIPAGDVKAIFIFDVEMQNRHFDIDKIVKPLSKIDQKIVFMLRYEDECTPLMFMNVPIIGKTAREYEINIRLTGLDMDSVWENLVIDLGDIEPHQGRTLIQQIDFQEELKKKQKELEKLEKKMHNSVQNRDKREIFSQIKYLRNIIEDMNKIE